MAAGIGGINRMAEVALPGSLHRCSTTSAISSAAGDVLPYLLFEPSLPSPLSPLLPSSGSIVSVSLAFAAVGSLVAGWLADKLGRRAALQLMAVPLVAGSAMR